MAEGKFNAGIGIDFKSSDDPDEQANFTNRKLNLEVAMRRSTPPYMPKLTEPEIRRISVWLARKEGEVKRVQNDSLYKFVYEVAGNLAIPVDQLFKYKTDERHSTERFFDVPGDDSQDDMTTIRERLIDSIGEKQMEIKRENILQVLKELVNELVHRRNLGLLQTDGGEMSRDSVEALDLYEFISMLSESQEIEMGTDPPTTIVVKKIDELKQHMQKNISGLPRLYVSRNPAQPRTFLGQKFFIFGARETTETLEPNDFIDVDDEVIQEYLLYHIPLGYDLKAEPQQKTAKIYQLERQLSSLEDLYAKSDIGAVRKRVSSALHWLERKEVFEYGDMSEELVMGLRKATMKVRFNVPGMQNVKQERAKDLFAGGSNEDFTTLFADLVAREINLVHFLEGIRGNYDRNHARIRVTIAKILNAMRKFVYFNGEIVVKNRQGASEWHADRLDFC